jgi:hypothetical protein
MVAARDPHDVVAEVASEPNSEDAVIGNALSVVEVEFETTSN